MTDTKALAVQALLMAGVVVRIELRKAGQSDPDAWWLGHLDTIAELLRPSPELQRLRASHARCEALVERWRAEADDERSSADEAGTWRECADDLASALASSERPGGA